MVLEKIKQLTPEEFNEFLDWLVRLEPFVEDNGRPPMKPNGLILLFKLMYFCRLELSSILALKLHDFDLQNKLIKISSDKYQKNITLPESLTSTFNLYIKDIDDNEKLFPVSQKTVQNYAKNAITLGGMKKLIQKIREHPKNEEKLNEILMGIENLRDMVGEQHPLLLKIASYVTRLYQDGENNKDTFNKLDEFLKPYYDNQYDEKY